MEEIWKIRSEGTATDDGRIVRSWINQVHQTSLSAKRELGDRMSHLVRNRVTQLLGIPHGDGR